MLQKDYTDVQTVAEMFGAKRFRGDRDHPLSSRGEVRNVSSCRPSGAARPAIEVCERECSKLVRVKLTSPREVDYLHCDALGEDIPFRRESHRSTDPFVGCVHCIDLVGSEKDRSFSRLHRNLPYSTRATALGLLSRHKR